MYSNGIITAPVSIYDVQRALGTSECDLGSLCKHTNINMWAKYKPVWYQGLGTRISVAAPAAYSGYNQTNPSTNMPDGNPNHVDGDYGIACSYYYQGTLANALSNLTSIMNGGWTYARPRGAGYTDTYGRIPACPFRLTDFEGYNSRASLPVWLSNPQIRANTYEPDGKATVIINLNEANDDDTIIGLETLTNNLIDLKRAVFFVAVVNRTSSSTKAAFFSGTIMQSDGTVDGSYLIDVNLSSSVFTSIGDYRFYVGIRVIPENENAKWFALPSSAQYPNNGTLTLYYDSGEAALDATKVYIAPSVDVSSISNFKLYSDISENGDGIYSMYSYVGTACFAILFHNTGSESKTFTRGYFNMSDVEGYSTEEPSVPTAMYVGSDSDSSSVAYSVSSTSTTSYTIGAGKYKWVCLKFENKWNTQRYYDTANKKSNQVELYLRYSNITILSDTLFIHYKSNGEGFEGRS